MNQSFNDGLIVIDENKKEVKVHGKTNFPVALYRIDVKKIHMEIVPWHWHEELEFIYILEGGGDFLVSEEKYTLTKGQSVLINSEVLHAFHLSPEYDNCVFISMVFHKSFVVSEEQNDMYDKYMKQIIEKKALRTVLIDEKDGRAGDILSKIEEVYRLNKEESYGYELETKSFVFQLWIIILIYAEQKWAENENSSERRESLDEKRAKDAINYIHEHYKENIELDEIAEHIHVSRSECCRCLKRSLGLTPFEYLMKFRVLTAARKLEKDKNTPVAQIAMDVGFNSSSYFNKIFKKYMGCTPSGYRKKVSVMR